MKKLIVPAIAAVALVGAGGVWFMSQGNGPAANVAQASAANFDRAAFTPHALDHPIGDPDAPVVMVEYGSFTCPHCATFHANVLPDLKADFVETGDVFYIKREVYFDSFGLWAGMVARCASPERYHGMVELIYQNQGTWIGDGEPGTVAANLRRLGRQAGLSEAEVTACLEDEDKALELTEFYRSNAETYGIRSTPSFVINGELHSNMSAADFANLLNDKLGR